MSLLRAVSGGLRSLLRKDIVDRDLDDEVRHYLEMAAREHMRTGVPRSDAERLARLELGGIESIKEDVRDAGWESTLESTLRDIRYAVRSLRAAPAFTAMAIVTLALGIGANAAMFSVVNAALLRPLPYADPERLTTLWTDDAKHGDKEEGTSWLNYLDWRAQSTVFIDLAVCSRGNPVMLGGDEPERLDAEQISANMLPLLGVVPLIGRNFSADDERRGDVSAILSHGLWQRRFGGSRDILGSAIELDGQRVRVIGVMPRGFFFPTEHTQLWLTMTMSPGERTVRTQDTWRVVGRLKPGVALARAQTEMSSIGERLASAYPQSDAGFAGYAVNVVPMLQQVMGTSLPRALWMLLGAVGFVLAIACANVANLLLVRGAARAHELAIRASLGASRGRIARQLLTESVVLAVAATVIGLVLATLLVRLGAVTLAGAVPRIADVRVDPAVIVFTTLVALASTTAFGLLPVWKVSRNAPVDLLRDGARRTGPGVAARNTRRALVAVECALAVMLVAGAGLLVRSLASLRAVDIGFRPTDALMVRVALPPQLTEAEEQRSRRGDGRMLGIIDRLAALPGVMSVGAMRDFVFTKNPDWVITAETDRGIVQSSGSLTSEYATPGVFAAVGATLAAGREFASTDYTGARVAVVNEAFATRFYGSVNAVGKRFKQGGVTSRSGWITIIGVVRSMRRGGPDQRALPEFYTPWAARTMDIVVRANTNTLALVTSVQAAVRIAEPRAAIQRIAPLDDVFGDTSAQRRTQTWLLAALAGLALLMSLVGIYGVVSSVVAARTREIGIRVALGARAPEVVGLVFGEALSVAAIGGVVGLGGALIVTGLMRHLLFGVGPRDTVAMLGSVSSVLAVAAVASILPARRAAAIDPIIALRLE